jgi:hypothetical protein
MLELDCQIFVIISIELNISKITEIKDKCITISRMNPNTELDSYIKVIFFVGAG